MTSTKLIIPTLETERLVLRGPERGDYRPFSALLQSVCPNPIGGPWNFERAAGQMNQLIANWLLDGLGGWSIIHKANSSFIGIVELMRIGDEGADVLIALSKSYEGRGLAYEACVAAVGFGYGSLGRKEITFSVEPSNTRSMNLAKRLGGVEMPPGLDFDGSPIVSPELTFLVPRVAGVMQ